MRLAACMIRLYCSIKCPEIRGPRHKKNLSKIQKNLKACEILFPYVYENIYPQVPPSPWTESCDNISFMLYTGATIKLPVNCHTVSFTSATVSAQASPLPAVRYLVGFRYGYFHTFRSVSDLWPMVTIQGLLHSAQTVSCRHLTLTRRAHIVFHTYGVFYTGSLPTAVA